jgi:predicted secreted Zn-dependent protease
MQALSKLNMVWRLENLFQTLYAYFSISPKKHLEFDKIIEIQSNKLFKCQSKMDFYVGTCKKHDEWILHSNGQDGFGL